MFKHLIESIRVEATQRGSLFNVPTPNRTPGENKTVKTGAARYLRRQAKKELRTKMPGEENIPRRGIKGWGD